MLAPEWIQEGQKHFKINICIFGFINREQLIYYSHEEKCISLASGPGGTSFKDFKNSLDLMFEKQMHMSEFL